MGGFDKFIAQAREIAEEELSDRNKKAWHPGMAIPVTGAVLSANDIVSLVHTAFHYWYTEGDECNRFSGALSQAFQKPHVNLVNSGSSANLIATLALTEGRKELMVVTTALGFPTTLAPIYQSGKIPIFVDVSPVTLAPDMNQVQRALEKYGPDIAGGIFSHVLGVPYPEFEMAQLFRQQGKFLLTDACDAAGALLSGGYPVGWWSDIHTYSFYPAHQICAGEGGAALTKDARLHRVMSSLSNWGRGCRCAPGQDNVCGNRFGMHYQKLPHGWDHKYTFQRLGYNLKMTEFQAALGASQMERLDEFVTTRIEQYNYLYAHLVGSSSQLTYLPLDMQGQASPFGFPILVRKDSPFSAQDLIAHLESKGIRTRRFFGGNLIRQPAFDHYNYYRMGDLAMTDYLMENAFWIGCWPGLVQEQLDYMVQEITSFGKSH